MPTCAQITDAINVLAEAATPSNPNSIVDLSSLVAPLLLPDANSSSPTPIPVQLSSGGTAILSIPAGKSVDGVLFRATVSGHLVAGNPNITNRYNLSFIMGQTQADIQVSGISADMGTGINGKHPSFTFVYYFFWDSITQKMVGFTILGGAVTGGFGNGVSQVVASQSDIQFTLFGNCNSQDLNGNPADPQDTLTITQFKLDLV